MLWLPAELEWVKAVDVTICYVFVPPPQFWVILQTELWQEHTCSTQAGFPKCCFCQHCPRALWPVILTDFLSGKNFWKVCCFLAGFAPACMSITVSVWGGEEETTTACVCISFSQRYCPLLFAFNKSVYEVSAVRYLLQVPDQWAFWKWSHLLNVLCLNLSKLWIAVITIDNDPFVLLEFTHFYL